MKFDSDALLYARIARIVEDLGHAHDQPETSIALPHQQQRVIAGQIAAAETRLNAAPFEQRKPDSLRSTICHRQSYLLNQPKQLTQRSKATLPTYLLETFRPEGSLRAWPL